MLLDIPPTGPADSKALVGDLQKLLQQPDYRELRPCTSCKLPCPSCGSSSCTCNCQPECPQAATQLSTDGERYPLEREISALVFALNSLRLCQPFWSCEGHAFQDGRIRRVPQVWFHSCSQVYPRIINELLARLLYRKKITHPWHICISHSGDKLQNTYSLEPDIKYVEQPQVEKLQTDIKVISRALLSETKSLAREYLQQIQTSGQGT